MPWHLVYIHIAAAWMYTMGAGSSLALVDITPTGCSTPQHSDRSAAIARQAAPQAKITVIPLADCNGTWLPIGVADAIDLAANTAGVVSMSVGNYEDQCPPDWQAVIDRHPQVLFVAAAGDLPGVQSQPAGCSHVLSVGWTGDRMEIYPSGPYALLAPGNDIYAGDPVLGTESGASASAPLVAACAALLRSRAQLTALQTRVLLLGRQFLDCGESMRDAERIRLGNLILIVVE